MRRLIPALLLALPAAALAQDGEVLELEPMEVAPEQDPLFEAERRLRALGKHLPEGATPKDGLRDRLRRALGADHDVTRLPETEQQAIQQQIDELQSLGAVGDREPPGPDLPVRLSDRDRRIQAILDSAPPPELD